MPQTLHDTILPPHFFDGRISLPGNDKLSADDKFAILDVSLRFEWCFDSQNMDELENLLTDDMVLDHFWGYREGKKAVMELLRAHVPTKPAAFGTRTQMRCLCQTPTGQSAYSATFLP